MTLDGCPLPRLQAMTFLTGCRIPKTSTKDPEFDSWIFYYPNCTWIDVNLFGILVFVLFDSILQHDAISAGWLAPYIVFGWLSHY